MKLETVLTVRLTTDQAEGLTAGIAELLPGATFGEGAYQVRFHHAPDAVRQVVEILDNLEIGYDAHEERSFSQDEIEHASALRLGRPDRVVIGGPRADLAQPTCRHAVDSDDAYPLTHLQLTDDLPATTFARTVTGGFVVDESLAATLIREHISGCLLRPVRQEQGAVTRWFEVLPTHRLPPMHSPPTKFVHDPEGVCPECGQGGLALHSLPFYDVAVDKLTDINLSFEQFGSGPQIMPEVLVSPRFFRVLREHGVPDLNVEPVLFV